MKLYPHQVEGADWLREKAAAFLADEQGVGKTITALAAARGLGRVLVVCPTVVLWNWKAEAEAWLTVDQPGLPPGLSMQGWDGLPPRVQVIADGKATVDKEADVVVVTHGLLLRPWIVSQLTASRWDVLVVDEAHAFKSVDALRTAALYGALAKEADRVWLMSGTPCPNHAGELYTHLRGLDPIRITDVANLHVMSEDDFINRFCFWRWTQYGKKVTGNRKDRLPELKARLDGFMLRRLLDDVLPDLPPYRFETVHLRPLKLDAALEALADELAPRVLEAVRDNADASNFFTAVKDEAGFKRFRRLCGIAKAGEVAELLHAELLNGDLKKVVVFAWHTDVIKIIASKLALFGALTITGDDSAKQRAQIVDAFQNHAGARVVVCNIVAGGVGVTLTESADVVFAEQDWTPGNNAQAASRCRRIGQTKSVRVRFIALADTIDELVTQSLRVKTRMIREVLGE